MDSLSSKHPLLILKELEQRFSLKDSDKQSQNKLSKSWAGLAVLIGQKKCIIETRHIQEILLSDILNDLSKVPATQDWFWGLVSLHGQALPIVDLAKLLFDQESKLSNTTRILVLNFGDFNNGILINKTLGLKRSNYSPEVTTDSAPAYLKQQIMIGNTVWPILDIDALGKDPSFRNTAALN